MVESNQSKQALQQVMKTGQFDTTKLSNETAQVLSEGLDGDGISIKTGIQNCPEATEELSDHVAIKNLVSLQDVSMASHSYMTAMYVVPKGFEVDGNRVGQWMLQDKQTYENLQVPRGTVIVRDQDQSLFGATPIIGG
jgi:hypothetical protein